MSLAALWWSTTPFVQRLANRAPRAVTVSEAGQARELLRWVTVRGVELRLDRELFPAAEPGRPGGLESPVPLLVDPSTPVAQWWTVTRALADLAAEPPGPCPALGGAAGAAGRALRPRARAAVTRRLAEFDRAPELRLPGPERGLLLQGREPSSLSAVSNGEPLPTLDDFERRTDARLALVRDRIHPDRQVQGLLVATPGSAVARIRAGLGVVVAPFLLQEGREPRDLESYIFAAAAICVLFLGAGFWGATRATRPGEAS